MRPKPTSLDPAHARPWAILESSLPDALARVAALRAAESGPEASAPAVQADDDLMPGAGGVLVIPVRGEIFPKTTRLMRAYGMMGLDVLRSQLRAAVASDQVSAVVLDIDSPGGMVEGVAETADLIRSLRKEKPIIAVSNTLCASAAYYLAAQAGEVVAVPDSFTGSIGTIMVHGDFSEFYRSMGINVTIIRNPPRKAEGNSLEPLTEQAQGRMQQVVDTYVSRFHADVAKGRGASVATVRAEFGQGITFMPDEARAAGMVDRVETLESVLSRAVRGRRATRARAEGELVLVMEDDAPTPELPAAIVAAPAQADDGSEAERMRLLSLGRGGLTFAPKCAKARFS